MGPLFASATALGQVIYTYKNVSCAATWKLEKAPHSYTSILPLGIYKNKHFGSVNLKIRNKDVPEDSNKSLLFLPLIQWQSWFLQTRQKWPHRCPGWTPWSSTHRQTNTFISKPSSRVQKSLPWLKTHTSFQECIIFWVVSFMIFRCLK